MRHRLFLSLVPLLAVALAAGGCNIFGSEEKPDPGAQAQALQAELDAFLKSNSTVSISSETLLDVAKESRLKAGIGVVQITRELSQPSSSTGLKFPFDDTTAAARAQMLASVGKMDTALALILYAGKLSAGGAGRLASGGVPDSVLQQRARRVQLTTGIDACSVYPDFLIARLLRVMLQFRTKLDSLQAAGLSPTSVHIVGRTGGGGYRIRIDGSITQIQANLVNGIINWLTDQALAPSQVNILLDPEGTFGCKSVLKDIIDPDKVRAYINNTVILSLRNSYVHSGTNP